jgi:VanZ family protein
MRRIKYFVPAIVWALFILVICTMSPKHIPKVEWELISADKAAHFGLFFMQTIFLLFAFVKSKRTSFYYKTISTVSVILFGMLVELLQMLMRLGRSADWDDVLANSIGVISASLLFIVFYRSLIKQR